VAGERPSRGVPAREQQPPLAEGELPRRRKQTHLAPQLKERVDADLAAERRGRAVPPVPPVAAGPPERPVPLAAPVPPADSAPAEPFATDPPTAGDATRHDRDDDVPDGPAVPDPGGPDPGADRPRTPEEMKSIMSSMQRGWERGRNESGQAAQAGQSRAEEDDTP
jgi:hypothetical protein